MLTINSFKKLYTALYNSDNDPKFIATSLRTPIELTYKNRVLTVHDPKKVISSFFPKSPPHQCDSTKTPFRYGVRTDPHHSLWHAGPIADDNHHHLCKYNATFEDFTPDDLNCLLKQIATFENEIKQDAQQGKATSSFTTDERHAICHDFDKFRQQHADVLARSIYARMEQAYTRTVYAAATSFANTLLENVCKPWLIRFGLPTYAASILTMGLQSMLTYMLNTSIAGVFGNITATLLRTEKIKEVLQTIGIPPALTTFIANTLIPAIALLTSPVTILELGLSITGAMLGAAIAGYVALRSDDQLEFLQQRERDRAAIAEWKKAQRERADSSKSATSPTLSLSPGTS